VTWTVEVEAEPGASEAVPDYNRRREFTDEQAALRHAKGCAVPGWFVTIIEPSGQEAII
jgi:hypothetical protein